MSQRTHILIRVVIDTIFYFAILNATQLAMMKPNCHNYFKRNKDNKIRIGHLITCANVLHKIVIPLSCSQNKYHDANMHFSVILNSLFLEITSSFLQKDVLDSLEFATGSAESTWGSVRAKMGHPEDQNLSR
jgi:hypothetical protein